MTENHSQPDISILIVNWNVRDLLDACLRSIKRFTTSVSYEVIVVDSASSDGSVAMVKEKYPWVTLEVSDENIGFTKGNNVALRRAKGRQIVYLNPDTELIEDVFTPLVSYLESNPRVGVVAPKLLNTDRSRQNSIGRFTRLHGLLNEYFLRNKAEQEQHTYPIVPTAVEYALGACLVVRGDLCRQIGGLDERFFMNNEETDLCLRLLKMGYTTIYFPSVALIHHGGSSSNYSPESRQRFLHENRKSQYLFFRKHSGWLVAQIAKLIILLAMISRIIVLGLTGLVKPSSLKAIKIDYYTQTVGWLLKQWH